MNSNYHLNHDQLCDLLIESTGHNAAQAHLEACPACTAELATLRASLLRFQQASILLADRELARRPAAMPVSTLVPSRRRNLIAIPAYVAMAAMLLFAVSVPLMRHSAPDASQPNPAVAVVPAVAPSRSTQSDEALLDEIDQDLDVSIPSPMEPLANPTRSASNDATPQGNR